MQKNLIKYGRLLLIVLYIIYLANVIVNVVLLQRNVTNSTIENGGAAGYILTYELSLLMAGGFFIIPTAIQCAVYHAVGKRACKLLVPSAVLEAVKIIGTATYIYCIDLANLPSADPVQHAFIITGIVIFAITAITEITLLTLMKLTENAG